MFYTETQVDDAIRPIEGCAYKTLNTVFTDRQTSLDTPNQNRIVGTLMKAYNFIWVINNVYATDIQRSDALSELYKLGFGNCNLDLSIGVVVNGYLRNYT